MKLICFDAPSSQTTTYFLQSVQTEHQYTQLERCRQMLYKKILPKWQQTQGLMALSITQHTAFVVEEHNIISCSHQLDNAGPWLAFDGGVGGQKANM
jgi:hypothetical protein